MQDLDASLSGFFPPQRICIVGAGHFGYLAAERLIRRYSKTAFLVVDQRREKLDRIEKDFGLAVQVQDTASFLENPWVDDTTWIVPAVPVHFAFLWIVNELKKSGRVERLPIPEIVESQVPNPYRAASGSLCASFATFICPDSCNEPDEFCTYTKAPRRGNLFEEVAKITVPGCVVIVIRSWQLAPGVGGYPRAHLKTALERLTDKPHGCALIATTCRCHGIIDGLRWEPAPSH